jgi:hypothetical protein
MSIKPNASDMYQINMPRQVMDLINQPLLFSGIYDEDRVNYSNTPNIFFNNLYSQNGSSKLKKSIPKVKEIDSYKKEDLEKIAKKHNVSLKTKDGKLKTKEQLFKSLKRKDLLKKNLKGGNEEEDKEKLKNINLSNYDLPEDIKKIIYMNPHLIINIINGKFVLSKKVMEIPLQDLLIKKNK